MNSLPLIIKEKILDFISNTKEHWRKTFNGVMFELRIEKLKEKCEDCNKKAIRWNGRNIRMKLFHIDGVLKNNKRENLKAFCPLCFRNHNYDYIYKIDWYYSKIDNYDDTKRSSCMSNYYKCAEDTHFGVNDMYCRVSYVKVPHYDYEYRLAMKNHNSSEKCINRINYDKFVIEEKIKNKNYKHYENSLVYIYRCVISSREGNMYIFVIKPEIIRNFLNRNIDGLFIDRTECKASIQYIRVLKTTKEYELAVLNNNSDSVRIVHYL